MKSGRVSCRSPPPDPAEAASLSPAGKRLRRDAHATLKHVTAVYERTFSFNTAVARVMELAAAFRAEAEAEPAVQREAAEILLFCMAPMAPHIAEELWSALGPAGTGKEGIFRESWPDVDDSAIAAEEKEFAVQINGKLRKNFSALPDAGGKSSSKRPVPWPRATSRAKPW